MLPIRGVMLPIRGVLLPIRGVFVLLQLVFARIQPVFAPSRGVFGPRRGGIVPCCDEKPTGIGGKALGIGHQTASNRASRHLPKSPPAPAHSPHPMPPAPSSPAPIAQPVEHNRVILDHESGRGHFGKTGRAPVDVEHPSAPSAVKMVVVRSGNLSEFIAWRLAGDRDGRDEPLFFKPPQRSVDRAQPERRQFS